MRRSRAPRRARRAPRRVRRARRAAGVVRGPTAKTYTYDFHLQPQMLMLQPSGQWQFPAGPFQGPNPLTNGSGNIAQYSSATGVATLADVALACSFKLSDCANFSAYTTMYDAYRLNSITCTIEYLNNSASVGSTGFMPTIYSYLDQDDAVPPPSVASIVGKQGVQVRHFGNNSKVVFSRKFRPTCLEVLGNNSQTAGFALNGVRRGPTWINNAGSGPNVNHYGWKAILTDLYTVVSTTPQSINGFRINWKYNVSFRSPLNSN